MDRITFFVRGKPAAQGSLQPIKSKSTGKTVMVYGKRVMPWRRDIAWAAKEALGALRIVGGCSATLVWIFERPKIHYRTGKYSHLLKPSAPDRHTQKPDIDKLERAVLDALTKIAYGDDCEVDTVGKRKQWGPLGGGSGLEITLRGRFHAL